MTIGIYLLKFSGTDKVYVGQSLRIEERFIKHKLKLKNGTANYKLLEAYRLYGSPNLEIICTCTEQELNSLENEMIEIYDSVNSGYNIRTLAVGGHGLSGELHGNSKYQNDDIIEVFELLINTNNSFITIHNITGVSIHTIRDISKGKAHKWLADYDNLGYNKLISLIGSRDKNTAKDQGKIYPLLLSPEGIVHNITNISSFAREHNLNKSHLCGVLNRLRKTHKGWKLK